jgi:hypothetical protein
MVDVLAARILSGFSKRPTADMLLVEARRRRLRASRADENVVQRPPAEPASIASDREPPDLLIADEDAIIEDESGDHAPWDSGTADRDHALRQRTGLACYRPLTTVTLARLSWSGSIDHAVLREAIACAPFDAAARAPNLVRIASVPGLQNPPLDEPSLYVRLGDDDVAALELALVRTSAEIGSRLAGASLLPDSLIGAPARASFAASQALAAYRGAALIAAWREMMGAPGLAEVIRDRDSAAVRLLSTLRALLGEA